MLIAVEGIDGTGKSSLVKAVAEAMPHFNDIKCVTVGEPTSPYYDFLNTNRSSMGPKEVALVVSAARQKLYSETVLPALSAKKVVLSDRCFDSTFVYQADAGRRWLLNLNRFMLSSDALAIPDITFFLSIDPKIAIERIKLRGETVDEKKLLPSLTQLQSRYVTHFGIEEATGRDIVAVDASKSAGVITSIVLMEIAKRIQK